LLSSAVNGEAILVGTNQTTGVGLEQGEAR